MFGLLEAYFIYFKWTLESEINKMHTNFVFIVTSPNIPDIPHVYPTLTPHIVYTPPLPHTLFTPLSYPTHCLPSMTPHSEFVLTYI